MNVRLKLLSAAAAIALTACGANEDPAANLAANDLNALVPAAGENVVAPEAPQANTAEPTAVVREKPATEAPEPKTTAPATRISAGRSMVRSAIASMKT